MKVYAWSSNDQLIEIFTLKKKKKSVKEDHGYLSRISKLTVNCIYHLFFIVY